MKRGDWSAAAKEGFENIRNPSGSRLIGWAGFLILIVTLISASFAQDTPAHPNWPGQGQLFVGTCYQPVDRTPEQVRRDIAAMHDSGFNVVRMGDLSWDYFEPTEGQYDFRAFDAVMNEMQAAGIKVILDIPGLPAPQWLHHRY